MTGEAIIEVRQLVNRFGAQTVHQDLDLDLYRGEVLGVVGGSGTGKSVLLRSILGLRRANAARALLVQAGLNPAAIDVRSHGEAELLVPTADFGAPITSRANATF